MSAPVQLELWPDGEDRGAVRLTEWPGVGGRRSDRCWQCRSVLFQTYRDGWVFGSCLDCGCLVKSWAGADWQPVPVLATVWLGGQAVPAQPAVGELDRR